MFAGLCMGMIMVAQRIAGWVERRLPNLTDKPMQFVETQLQEGWNVPSKECFPMVVGKRRGTIMGRVTARCWRTAGRIYHQVRGPESPEANTHENEPEEFVFCEADYAIGRDRKTDQFSVDRARTLWCVGGLMTASCWRTSGRTTASSAVAAGCYRLEREKGYVTLTFWTPESVPAHTVYFYYREGARRGQIELRPHRWPIPHNQPTGDLR